MKKILFALAMFAAVVPALPQARADVSIDFFYNNISGGNWIDVEGYGFGWQPDLATSDPNWRPYADGYWAYTEVGWTWVSYEDFGWATYHYGRWASLADYGWVWFPGSDLEWGPAWVSWRTGGDYVGWAPLPPRGPGIAYAGGPIGGRVDIEFDIGPAYYNFIDVRFIGEPVLRDRIFPYSQNVTYITNTVNVTNITVQNNIVYNYGPDYNTLSSYSSRPIQRLKIEHQPSADLSAAVKTGALTKVQGDKLVVAAPQKINKAPAGAAPPKVKGKVAQPKIQKGWAGVSDEAQVKEKMKTENPKNIPPPTRAAAKGRAGAEASPEEKHAPAPATAGGPVASPGTTGAPTEKGKGRRGRPSREAQPGVTAAPEDAAEIPAAAGKPTEKGKRHGKPGETGRPSESPPDGASGQKFKAAPTEARRTPPGPGDTQNPIIFDPNEQTGAAPGSPQATQPPGKHKGQIERGAASPSSRGPGGGIPQTERELTDALQSGHRAQPGAPPASGAAAPSETRGGKQKGQERYGQPGGAPGGGPPAGPERGQGKPEGGKKKGEKASPTPGPQ